MGYSGQLLVSPVMGIGMAAGEKEIPLQATPISELGILHIKQAALRCAGKRGRGGGTAQEMHSVGSFHGGCPSPLEAM